MCLHCQMLQPGSCMYVGIEMGCPATAFLNVFWSFFKVFIIFFMGMPH